MLVVVQSRCFQWWHHPEEICPRAALGVGIEMLLETKSKLQIFYIIFLMVLDVTEMWFTGITKVWQSCRITPFFLMFIFNKV